MPLEGNEISMILLLLLSMVRGSASTLDLTLSYKLFAIVAKIWHIDLRASPRSIFQLTYALTYCANSSVLPCRAKSNNLPASSRAAGGSSLAEVGTLLVVGAPSAGCCGKPIVKCCVFCLTVISRVECYVVQQLKMVV